MRKVWESHLAKFHWGRLEAETGNASEAPIQMIQTFSTASHGAQGHILVLFFYQILIRSHKRKEIIFIEYTLEM